MSCNNFKCLKFQIGFNCNKSCSFCIIQSQDTTKNLSLETVNNALNDAHLQNGLERIVITGGEPTIPQYLPITLGIINKAKKINANSTIYTNGELLDKQLFQTLKDAGLTEIRLSIYEPVEWGKLSITLDNFEKYGFKRFLKVTVTKNTFQNLPNLLSKLPSIKPDRFQIKPFNQTGIPEVDKVEEMTPEQVLEMARIMLEYRKKSSFQIDLLPLCYEFLIDDVPDESICHCNCGKGESGYLVINPNGDVLPCGAYGKKIGNVNSPGSNILEMWNNSTLLNTIRELEIDTPEECKQCHHLPKCKINDCHSTTFNYYGDFSRGNPQCPILAKKRFTKI